MNYTENNQETTEKPRLPRDYPPAQLKRSEREPSKGHCGPRWYGAAGKHNSWCSIFRGASPGSSSLENTVVNNIIDSVYSGDVKWVRWCITHPSTLQLSPVNELTGGRNVKFHTLLYRKLWDSPAAKAARDDLQGEDTVLLLTSKSNGTKKESWICQLFFWLPDKWVHHWTALWRSRFHI